MDEKLEFSAQDLGRLAYFIASHPVQRPFDLVLEWLRIHAPDSRVVRQTFDWVSDGYYEHLSEGPPSPQGDRQ